MLAIAIDGVKQFGALGKRAKEVRIQGTVLEEIIQRQGRSTFGVD